MHFEFTNSWLVWNERMVEYSFYNLFAIKKLEPISQRNLLHNRKVEKDV